MAQLLRSTRSTTVGLTMYNHPAYDDSSSQRAISETSLSLLRRLKMPVEDKAAWAQVTFLYAPAVLYRCKRANLSTADTEDVIQEVFCTLHMKIASFERRHKKAFRSWLRAITENKIGDMYKRLNKQARAEGGTEANLRLEQQPDLADSDESEAEECGLIFQQAIRLAEGRFEPKSIEAFLRVVVDGEASQEVADKLGVTPNALYIIKSRILTFLRQELDVEFD